MSNRQFPRLNEFVYFIKERWNIHQRRLAGDPPPWTKDEILQTYRFTNVKREDDRVTKWINQNWLKPHQRDYDTVVFAMAVARTINLPAALEELGYPTRWDGKRFVKIIDGRRARGLTSFNNAYMINASGAREGQSKADYLAERVLGPLWKERKFLGQHISLQGSTLCQLHEVLLTFNGFAGFMSGQVIADVKYTPAGLKAADWHTFAVSGPGSKRGLNWVCGRDVLERWREQEWYEALMALRELANAKTELDLDAANTQNCLCEFSKYCKVKYIGRRAKQTFKPSEEPYV